MRTIDSVDGIRITKTSTASLLAKVLWITTAGFLLTAFGAYIAPEKLGLGWPLVALVNLGLVFAIASAARRSTGLGLTLFYIYTLLMGVQISPILNIYMHTANGPQIVFQAALTTAVGMAVMALVAQVVNFNYARFQSYLLAGVIALIIVGVIGFFFHFVSPGLYAWATLVIFTGLLLVDFMRLRDADRSGLGASTGTAVWLALSIYLDAINIFIALLQIFGNGSGGRRDNRWS